MRFENAYEQFKIYAMKRHKKQSFNNLSQDFKTKILPYFKDKDIYKITEKDILIWQDFIYGFNYSNTYNDKIYYVFCLFYDYICLYYNVSDNLIRKVGNFKHKTEIINHDFYTLKEFKRFIKGFDNIVYRSYFIFAFFTGTRPCETMALKFSDFKGKYISINKSIERRGNRDLTSCKNPYSVRTIALSNKAIRCIKKLRKYYIKAYGYDYDYFIFGGLKPLSPTSIDRYKKQACEKVGIRTITQHQFRHSYATYLISNGIPLNVVSKLLGHSTTEVTSRVYVQHDLSQEKRVFKTLNSVHFF